LSKLAGTICWAVTVDAGGNIASNVLVGAYLACLLASVDRIAAVYRAKAVVLAAVTRSNDATCNRIARGGDHTRILGNARDVGVNTRVCAVDDRSVAGVSCASVVIIAEGGVEGLVAL